MRWLSSVRFEDDLINFLWFYIWIGSSPESGMSSIIILGNILEIIIRQRTRSTHQSRAVMRLHSSACAAFYIVQLKSKEYVLIIVLHNHELSLRLFAPLRARTRCKRIVDLIACTVSRLTSCYCCWLLVMILNGAVSSLNDGLKLNYAPAVWLEDVGGTEP